MLNIFVWFMLIAAMASVMLMVYAVASHSSERSFFLIFASICTFLYTAGYLLEIISPTLEASFMGVRVQKMGTQLRTLIPGETMEQVKQFEGHNELCLQINGERRFYKVTQTRIRQSSKDNGICFVFHDITDKETQLKSLYGKATFDPLMHIYNRAAFFDFAGLKLNADEAKEQPYGLLMIDLDHFKMVNDTYGHPCGDIVLEAIAAIVRNHFSKGDIVGRYGGEEIVVLMENISVRQMLDTVEKLREVIEHKTIYCHENSIGLTASIGMAHSPAGNVHSLEDMILQADLALYEAKNGGRNCACLYEVPVS